MNDHGVYIAIDIGGTHVRVACFSSLSNPVFEHNTVFELSHVFEDDFGYLVEVVSGITEDKILAIGIGIPGKLNEEKSALISALNIPEWVGINLKSRLSEKFDCPVYIDNDAVTSALGEALYGGSQREDFIFLIWGTGVGGALVKVQPELKVSKLKDEDYHEEIRKMSHGKNLLEKYGKPLGELASDDWDKIISDFGELIFHISYGLGIKNFVIGGGIALKQTEKIVSLSKKLKDENDIKLRVTSLGDNHTFGLYGSAGLIAEQGKYS